MPKNLSDAGSNIRILPAEANPPAKPQADTIEINHDMIILARESMGLSQTEFARRVKVSQSKISRIEDGLNPEIDTQFAERLEEETGFPVVFFSDHSVRKPLTEAFYRKKKTIPVSVLSKAEARINLKRIEIEKLLPKIDWDVKERPFWAAEDFEGGCREIARMLRYLWEVPRGPIKDLTVLVEDAGCIVVFFDFGTPKIDGVTTYASNRTPLIFLNSRFPSAKMRLTLAHELGHVIMHRIPTHHMEDEAFEFASEFLMPESDIGPELTLLSLDRLARLKLKWKVSMQAILMWARKLGRVSESGYKSLQIRISSMGYRTREPNDDVLTPEQPSLLKEIVQYHLNALQYSKEEICKILKTRRERAEEYFDTAIYALA